MAQGRTVLWSALVMAAVTTGASAQVPTFNQAVAPILFTRCATCHRPGEVAPMALLSYKQARPWARAIKAKVVAREMPPYFADVATSHKMQGANVLTPAEIQTIAAWADGGAPEGAGPAPTPPTFTTANAAMGTRPPDYVLDSPDAVEVPATGTIPWLDLWSKAPFDEDTFFEAAEIRPLNRAIVHHVTVQTRSLPKDHEIRPGPAWLNGPTVNGVLWTPKGEAIFLGAGGAAPASANEGRRSEGPRTPRGGSSSSAYIGAYAPGSGVFRAPPGMAKRIGPDNNYLNWSVHYTNTGRPEKGRDQLFLWLARGEIRHEVVSTTLTDVEIVKGKELIAASERGRRDEKPNILANDDNYTIVGLTPFDSPVTLVNFWPHMHLRGTAMKFTAVYPDGREETLLDVPRYRYDWQLFYTPEQPIKLPAGTVVRVESHYDNSVKNRVNPAPETDVQWGEMSWQEMHFPYVDLVVDSQPVRARSGTQ